MQETDNRIANVRLGPKQSTKLMNYSDPFDMPAEKLLESTGLSPNFRRNTRRKFEKAQTDTGTPIARDRNELSGDDATSKQIVNSAEAYGYLGVVEPKYNMNALAAMYEMNAVNFAAVNAKVANIVGLGYRLEPSAITIDKLERTTSEEQRTKRRRTLERQRNMLREWLETRNNEDTFTQVMRKVYTDVETMGNGYIEIGRKSTGEIGYIGHVPAATVRVRRVRDGFVQIVNQRVTFFRNFQGNEPNPITSDQRPNEIIHIKNYTPTSSYYGVPAAVAAQHSIMGQEYASRFNLDYFKNMAVPRYIFWLKGARMDSTSEERLFEFFQGLRGNSHRTLIVPIPADSPDGGEVSMKMEPIETGKQDSSFTNYRKANREDVLTAHRTPASKIGITEGIGLAAARESDRTFKEQVTRPAQESLAKRIDGILKEVTDLFNFEFNEMTLTDEDAQSKINERYLRMQVLTPNEVRTGQLDLPAIPDGDNVIDLRPQQAAEQRTRASGNRERDQERSSNASDADENPRNEQGEGRQST